MRLSRVKWSRRKRPPLIETTTLTAAAGSSTAETDAVCRAVLATIWPDIDWFTLDLTSLGDTPEQEAPVAALQPHRNRTLFRGRRTQLAVVNLGETDGTDEAALEAVLPLLTSTLESVAWGSDLEDTIYVVKNRGTECRFTLTDTQMATAESRLRDMGVSTDVLSPVT